MTISNVVLDRDKKVVRFDPPHGMARCREVIWLDRWVVNEKTDFADELNAYLSRANLEGGSLENLDIFGCTIADTPKPDQEPTPDYYNKTFKGVKFDPYRVCKMYDINGGPREHIVKKMLRGINKDDGINTELDLINVVEGQLRRWKEMIKEDAE